MVLITHFQNLIVLYISESSMEDIYLLNGSLFTIEMPPLLTVCVRIGVLVLIVVIIILFVVYEGLDKITFLMS